ncbi:hypothetical protein [Jannaschia seohaensis]|uniref:hypothetical protein n=1 Tax=Jannaschia seohaensis TaxID=475081 RepID=UPI000D6D5B2B|nr:hypothetical protein [Jannaschia seohaensis]
MRRFWADETGNVSLDWVVLTSVLVATGIAVIGTMQSGIETASVDVAEQMRGQVVRSSFESELCPGGIPALQAREDLRAAFAQEEPLNVATWMAESFGDLSDQEVSLRYLRDLADAAPVVSDDAPWTRARVELAALACEVVARGLD